MAPIAFNGPVLPARRDISPPATAARLCTAIRKRRSRKSRELLVPQVGSQVEGLARQGHVLCANACEAIDLQYAFKEATCVVVISHDGD
jgi:hypothetical protein